MAQGGKFQVADSNKENSTTRLESPLLLPKDILKDDGRIFAELSEAVTKHEESVNNLTISSKAITDQVMATFKGLKFGDRKSDQGVAALIALVVMIGSILCAISIIAAICTADKSVSAYKRFGQQQQNPNKFAMEMSSIVVEND